MLVKYVARARRAEGDEGGVPPQATTASRARLDLISLRLGRAVARSRLLVLDAGHRIRRGAGTAVLERPERRQLLPRRGSELVGGRVGVCHRHRL